MTLKFELGFDFLTIHLPAKFDHQMINRSDVIVLTNKQTSHTAQCVTFAVARIHVKGLPLEIGEILHIFPSGTESMGDWGSKKAYTGPRTGI